MITRTLAALVDHAFNRMAPVNIQRRSVGADYLSDLEQQVDAWAPDELWAAEQRRTAKQPAGADVPAPSLRSVAGVGGSTSLEADVLVTVTRVLRECETPWPHATASIVTRELLHHYTVTPK
jgi:hypothetical protein